MKKGLVSVVLAGSAALLASCTGGSVPPQSPGIPTTSQVRGFPPARSFASGAKTTRPRRSIAMPTDWDSFGFDLERTGFNPYELTVGVDTVGSLQDVWSFNVGSSMVHEPVYAYGVNVNGELTNILYAGSAHAATMYAINAQTGAVIWKKKVARRTYECGGTNQAFSIGETPAIDRGKNLIYFSDGYDQVHALSLATGVEAQGWPLTVASWQQNFMHGGFTYNPANGQLYAVTGSTCDISPWYGRIVAINTNGPSIAGTFYTMSGTNQQGTSGGGIWGPGGASIDPATNDVFIATGNADTHAGLQKQNADYAEQVIELSAQLNTVLANDYPTNIPDDGKDDFDFGATPLLFQPPQCPPLLAAINKSGMFELYDRGSISSGPIQYIAMSVPSDAGSFIGVPAFDPETGYVYVSLPSTQGIYQPGIAAFSVASNCTLNTTPVWSANFGPDGNATEAAPRSPISIANGVVYVSNYTGDTEYAFNAATGAQLWELTLPSSGRQGTVVANGMVYVSSSNGTISAWAPLSEARKLRQQGVKVPPVIQVHDVSIPGELGGVIDLRGSPSDIAKFGQPDR
jgi:outer membrane protein assembly factor BamB